MTNRFHLDKTNAKLMGVCAGLADYMGVDVLLVRVATIVLTLAGLGLIIPAYLAIGLLADSNPEGTNR